MKKNRNLSYVQRKSRYMRWLQQRYNGCWLTSRLISIGAALRIVVSVTHLMTRLPNVCQVIKNTPSRYLESAFSCPGRESNPHGRFGPRDFRTTVAFAIRRASRSTCLGSGLFLHHRTGSIRCVVSSLCTFLLPEAWLKITISMTC